MALADPSRSLATALPLQLLRQFVEETPVGALGQELVRGILEHPDLVEAQGVEAQGVLRAIFTPSTVGELLYDLKGMVIAFGKALVDHELRGLLGLAGTDIRR